MTLVASFHHPVQAINKSAQIREAIQQGHKTVEDVQEYLKDRDIQASESLIRKVLEGRKPSGFWKKLESMVKESEASFLYCAADVDFSDWTLNDVIDFVENEIAFEGWTVWTDGGEEEQAPWAKRQHEKLCKLLYSVQQILTNQQH